MITLEINPHNPQQRLINKAVDIIKSGGLAIYPTDTYYGLGCDLNNKKAIEKIYRLKQRDFKKPFSFICPDLTNISQYAKVSNQAYRTMKRLLPGPYTFILEATKLVPQLMLSKKKECGIRVPNNQIPLQIVKTLENPLVSTTVNLEGEEVPDNLYEIEDLFKNQIDVFIDGGFVPNKPSTVISLISEEPEIIRAGLGEF